VEVRILGLGPLAAALILALAAIGTRAETAKPDRLPDSRSEAHANPSATAVDEASGLALEFRAAPDQERGDRFADFRSENGDRDADDDSDEFDEHENRAEHTAVADTGALGSPGFAARGASSDEGAHLGEAGSPPAIPEPSSLLVCATGLLWGGRAMRSGAQTNA